jgi:TPR repeat protein
MRDHEGTSYDVPDMRPGYQDRTLPIALWSTAAHLELQAELETAAAAGDAAAMGRLGLLLRLRADEYTAGQWLLRATEAGDAAGTLAAAERVARAWWCPQPAGNGYFSAELGRFPVYAEPWPDGGQELLELAADRGDTDALVITGRQHAAGGHPNEALERFVRAAELGAPAGMVWAGRTVAAGDPDAAGDWFRRAARLGSRPGTHELVAWLSARPGDHGAEIEAALEATAEDADLASATMLAQRALARGDRERAAHWYRRATDMTRYDDMELHEAYAKLLRDLNRPEEFEALRAHVLRRTDDEMRHPQDQYDLDFMDEYRAEVDQWPAPPGP